MEETNAAFRGFTLIELLVVVTIIVILLALLAPALDRAIYQAALVQCSGKLNAMASGVMQYAFENRRHYPDRGLQRREYRDTNPLPINPQTVKRFSVDYDIRPIHRTIFSLNKTLQCPLSPEIDLENYDLDQEDIGLDASYAMWWAWQYKDENNTFTGMFKYGDRFSHDERLYPPLERINRFNVLAGDIDLVWGRNGGPQASHPDRDPRLMSELRLVGEWFIERGTVGRWWNPNNRQRGVLDTNYVFDDGAVARYNDVPQVQLGPNHPDRVNRRDMTRVSINFNAFNDDANNVDKMHIPLR